jgi:hypothetical protein
MEMFLLKIRDLDQNQTTVNQTRSHELTRDFSVSPSCCTLLLCLVIACNVVSLAHNLPLCVFSK